MLFHMLLLLGVCPVYNGDFMGYFYLTGTITGTCTGSACGSTYSKPGAHVKQCAVENCKRFCRKVDTRVISLTCETALLLPGQWQLYQSKSFVAVNVSQIQEPVMVNHDAQYWIVELLNMININMIPKFNI